MAKWFGAKYNQEVRFSSAVKCKKGPQVLTSLLNFFLAQLKLRLSGSDYPHIYSFLVNTKMTIKH